MADPFSQGFYPMRGLYQSLATATLCLQIFSRKPEEPNVSEGESTDKQKNSHACQIHHHARVASVNRVSFMQQRKPALAKIEKPLFQEVHQAPRKARNLQKAEFNAFLENREWTTKKTKPMR